MLTQQEVLKQLAERGFRLTQSRRAIVAILYEAEEALTPAQVSALARRRWPRVGLVTVYRTLELLAELGLARRLHTDDGCHSYTRASAGHCHDLICQSCGRVVEFEGCDLSNLLEQVERDTGFAIASHMLELAGLCPACQEREGK